MIPRFNHERAFFVLLLLLVPLSGCDRKSPSLALGEQVPAINLEQLAGPPVSFPSAYRGRLVVIHFWADWCVLCRRELLESEPLYQRYRDKGVVMLAINLQQPRKTVSHYMADLNISYPVLLDREGVMARRYGIEALPVVYLINRQGELQARMLGGSSPAQLERIIKGLL